MSDVERPSAPSGDGTPVQSGARRAASVEERIGVAIRTFLQNRPTGSRGDAPSAETALFQEGLLDSFGFVEMIGHVEAETGLAIDVTAIDLDRIATLGEMTQQLAAAAR